jgi:hypothetical protein
MSEVIKPPVNVQFTSSVAGGGLALGPPRITAPTSIPNRLPLAQARHAIGKRRLPVSLDRIRVRAIARSSSPCSNAVR